MSRHRYTPSEAASASDDLNDYDVISDHDPRSLESSVADLRLDSPAQQPSASTSTWLSAGGQSQSHSRLFPEPNISDEARRLYETAELSAEDIQSHVQRSVVGSGEAFASHGGTVKKREKEKAVRIYVEGVFDFPNVG